MLIYLLLIFTVPFYCLWRRWFGSSEIWWKVSRSIKCIIFLLVTTGVVYLILKNIYIAVCFSGISYYPFFARQHGPGFDEGRDGYPDEEMLKRYNKGYEHFIPDLLIRNKKNRYGYTYDLIWLGVRYLVPAILLACIPHVNFHISLIGFFVSPIYAMWWTIKEKDKWLPEKIPYTNSKASACAEYCIGALYGLFPLFLN